MKAIELAILRVLRDAHPNMMRRNRLHDAASYEHESGITLADFDRALNALQKTDGGAQVFGTAGHDDTKWKITAEGLARLAG